MQDSIRDAVLQGILEELITAVISSPAMQDEAGAVCFPAITRSSISTLKEGVDDSCDTEFQLESLEADGPADSWLRNADISSSGITHAENERLLCKGPSWDRFVQQMAGQKLLAAETASHDTSTSQQSTIAAAGLSTAMQRTSSDTSSTPGPDDASYTDTLTVSRQSSHVQNNRTPSCTGSGRLPSPWGLNSSANAAGAPVQVEEVALESPLPPLSHSSRSSSLQRALVPPSDAANPRTPGVKPEAPAAVHTPVHGSSSRCGRAAQEVENAAWMASLRKGNVSGSNIASRRISRSQSAAGASPHTPTRTISKLTHSKSARASAPGHMQASSVTPPAASSSKPLTPATGGHITPHSASRSSSSKYSLRPSRPGTPTADMGALSMNGKAGSSPSSAVLSPGRQAAGGNISAGAAGKVAGRRSDKQSAKSGIAPATALTTAAAGINKASSCKLPESRSNSPKSNKPQQSSSAPQHTGAIAAADCGWSAAKAAADGAAAAAEQLRGAARVTSGDSADVPLPVGAQREELWASDTTAVQLFMDEYKGVLDAVDTAYDGSAPPADRPLAALDLDKAEYSVTVSQATAQEQPLEADQHLAAKKSFKAVVAVEAVESTSNGWISKLEAPEVIGGDGVAPVVADDVVQQTAATGQLARTQVASHKDADQLQQQVLQESPAAPTCGCRCAIM